MQSYRTPQQIAGETSGLATSRIGWTDPVDWMGNPLPLGAPYLYRPFEGPDEPYIRRLLE